MAPSRPFTGGAPEAPRGGTHILQGVVADRVKNLYTGLVQILNMDLSSPYMISGLSLVHIQYLD